MSHFGYEIHIKGLVQGVGFRPFVFNIAKELNLKGEVYNNSLGVVIILECSNDELEIFKEKLFANLPPLARIDDFSFSYKKLQKTYNEFIISTSQDSEKFSPILSDFALCEDCYNEFYDEKNPRFKYPFITCTNCGPRFSIIKKLPYDRVNTTMDEFKMCSFCQSEYEDPTNRRFHAQPLSCPKCKITIFLKDKNQNILAKDEKAFILLAKLLEEGKIIAFKGMGGFHLICDSTNKNAINELRIRKNRPKKPFAIMVKDLKMAQELAFINEAEAKLLTSNLKPIVILNSKNIHKSLASDTNKIGIMLAYMGTHLMLFEHFKKPIIATSANLSSQSIIYEETKLLEQLSDVFDFYLDYDRAIHNSSDDSIAQVISEKTMFLRTSRGLNPLYINTADIFNAKENILALGSELKNEFACFFKNQIFISPYIGDMKSLDIQERFFKILTFFQNSYKLNFDQILSDKHPQFNYVKEFKDDKNFRVQHHYAHLCACLFEHKIYKNDVLAFVFDGTGYGDDGKIWGGEIFRANLKSYERLNHFKNFKLINADIKNIANLALALIFDFNLENKASEFLAKFSQVKLSNLKKIHTQSSLYTSSLGRIIDAFGAFAFDIQKLDYEAQIGLLMEKYYDKNLNYSYKFEIKEKEICFKNAFLQALEDKDKVKISTGLLNGIANLIIEYSKDFKEEVLLCGGVFQNKTLLEILDRKKFTYKTSLQFPCNDSSIALGQLVHYLSLKT
ncbi:carbamoyltransferase HypF [Campylobacter sp. RKI_CA19_01128]|uniref:carbamoyltransferase HypF n=1 Tax=unclassified Campylobacter TaxID=2593542 RepID=UPI0021E88741|nr:MULTISPECIES: carbamoyltransferase HypF [unclassified Campylobacter]MCV3349149.1 carbamoyltransferase HypF [Campylobacter sp. RKI_CA19_01127]MCV3355282.1 carbamoyltransferase HypF [Campylobacter sp. RKI_CA19_01128]HEC1776236.1 carbamoyltransferase HypF [Campylobacter lari]